MKTSPRRSQPKPDSAPAARTAKRSTRGVAASSGWARAAWLKAAAACKATLEGGEVTESTQLHLDRCLTCRNCETTCPSGVKYHNLLDIGRDFIEQQVQRPLGERVVRGGELVRDVFRACFDDASQSVVRHLRGGGTR